MIIYHKLTINTGCYLADDGNNKEKKDYKVKNTGGGKNYCSVSIILYFYGKRKVSMELCN